MYKIKLLILLLTSTAIFSCNSSQILIQTVINIELPIESEYSGYCFQIC